MGSSKQYQPSWLLTNAKSTQSISTGSRTSTPPFFPSEQTAPSKIKLEQFSPILKQVLKNVYSFLRVQLATIEAFPVDRPKFIGDCFQAYSQLSNTSPDFKEYILMAEEKQREMYTAYVSSKAMFSSLLTHKDSSYGRQLLR